MMKPYYDSEFGQIYNGDSLKILKQLPDVSVNCCVTSPPYWGLRDYGNDNQIGLEKTPEEYVSKMVEIFREVKRVLRNDGTLWLNIGDTYAAARSYQVIDNKYKDVGNKTGHVIPSGLKQKDLIGVPWRIAFALQADGWYLRQDIIWSKPNPMPESVTDRCTKSHEYIFLLSKSQKYYYDHESIKEPMVEYERNRRLREKSQGLKSVYNITSDGKTGQTPQSSGGAIKNNYRRQELAETGFRNKRSVWTITTKPFKKAHFATFPPVLIEPCILAGCPKGGIVLDPFFGAGTTGIVAYKHDRKFIGIELSKQYCDEIAIPRIKKETAQMKLFA